MPRQLSVPVVELPSKGARKNFLYGNTITGNVEFFGTTVPIKEIPTAFKRRFIKNPVNWAWTQEAQKFFPELVQLH